MGLKTKAYMEGRAKLLEAGGKVVKQGGSKPAGGLSKWLAKAETKGYNQTADFVDPENGEPPKKRSKRE